MSTTIDNKVVSMQFDNKQFEQNVQTSLSTLERLKSALRLDGASKGLDDINVAAKNNNLGILGDSAEKVGLKFNGLWTMADQALRNITNSVQQTATQVVKSFTIDPLKSGWGEYELKMGSIQTIMSSTGEDLSTVNKYLEELNKYSDQTIYSFSDMTQNIGKFTNAGVKLEDAVSAIKGIANAAALSGANSNEASRAMYNFAQALSSGSVKLIDWKSIELANMGTVEFKNQLIETALALGTVVKEGDSYRSTTTNAKGEVSEAFTATSKFNESLNAQWMTTEVLTQTLSRYADASTDVGARATKAATEIKTFSMMMDTLKESAQSGWAQTWELIFGDFEEGKALWTSIGNFFGDIINKSSEARNSLIKGALDKNPFEGFKGTDFLKKAADGISEGIRKVDFKSAVMGLQELEAYAEKTGIPLNDLIADLDLLNGRTLLLNSFKNIGMMLVDVFTAVKDAWIEVFPPTSSDQLYDLIASFHKFTTKLELTGEPLENLKSTLKGVFSALDIGVTFLKEAAGGIIKIAGSLSGIGTTILSATGSVGEWVSSLRDSIKETDIFGLAVDKIVGFVQLAIDKFKEFAAIIAEKVSPEISIFSGVLKAVWNIIKAVGSLVAEIGAKIGSAFTTAFQNGDFSTALDVLNGGILAAVLLNIKKFIGGLTDSIDGVGDIVENVTDILDSVKGCFEAWQQDLKANALLKIAGAIGILAVSLLVISTIDSEKIADALTSIAVLFVELMAAMAVFGKIDKSSGMMSASIAMIGISTAVLILASAMKKIAVLDVDQLTKGLAGIGVLLAEIEIFLATAKFGGKGDKMISTALSMILLGAALKIMADVCSDFAQMSWEEIAKGLVGVGALLAEIDIFLNTAKFSGKVLSSALGMVAMGAALKIMANVCSDFAQMSWGEIGKGLAGIGAILTELALFTNVTGNAKHVVSTGLALVLIGASMKIFASAVADFAQMSWEEIGKGLTGMAGALAAVAIAVNLMPKNMIGIGTGLVIVSASLLILAQALEDMSGLTWEEIAKGLVTLGGSMLILAAGLNLMNGTLAGSAALLVAAAALAVLAPVLTLLGSMSWESIAKGLVAIAGAFTIIGVAGLVLGPLVPTILGLSAAIALFGVGCLAVGAGVTLLATGITALAVAFSAGIASIVSGVLTILGGIGDAIILVCEGIAGSAVAIGKAVKAIVLSLVDVLVECVPALASGAIQLLLGIVDALVEYGPQLVSSLYDLFINIINVLGERIPDFIVAVMNFLGKLFEGVIEALNGLDFNNFITTIAGVGLMAALIAAVSAVTPLIPGAMVGILGVGAVIAELALVLAAVGALAQIPGFSYLVEEGGNLLLQIGTALGKFVGGLAAGVAEGVTSTLPQVAINLSDFMTNLTPFIEGAKNIDGSMLEGVASLTAAIALITAADVIQTVASFITGGNSLVEFGEQLVPFGENMKKYSDTVSGINPVVVTASAMAASALSELATNLPNSGGMISWFTGDNELADFAEQLEPFGAGMKAYADSVAGIDSDAVTSSANAAKSLAELASNLPNTGGLLSWFSGDNDLTSFGDQLVPFGDSIKSYADSIKGIDADAVVSSANAAKTLAELSTNLPNSGGVVSWFTGDNDLATFAEQLAPFGEGMKKYSDSIKGIDAEAVTSSATAAKTLAELALNLPNSGGMVSWFTGDNSLATFAEQLAPFGESIKAYSDAVIGIDAAAVEASVNGAKAISELATNLPNSGGVVSWFTGDNSLASFVEQLAPFGEAMKAYADSVAGIDAESVTSSANAAKAISELATNLPNSGGVVSWFTGDNDLSGFVEQIAPFGEAMKAYADSVAGIDPVAVESSANAAKVIAELATNLPNSGGVVSWFTGDNDLGYFVEQLKPFGAGMKSYADAVAGIDAEAVTSSATAAKVLSELATNLPNSGGVVSWFTGDNDLGYFVEQLIPFGEGMKSYADAVAGIDAESVEASVNGAKALSALSNNLPNSGGVVSWFTGDNTLKDFVEQIAPFGAAMKKYSDSVTGIDGDSIISSVNGAKALTGLIDNLPNSGGLKSLFSGDISLDTFGQKLKPLGEGLKAYSDSVIGIDTGSINNSISSAKKLLSLVASIANTKLSGVDKFKTAVAELSRVDIKSFISNFSGSAAGITSTIISDLKDCLSDISNMETSFSKAGKNIIKALLDGISSETSNFTKILSELLDKCDKLFKEEQSAFKQVGTQLLSNLKKGIDSGTKSVTNSLTKILNRCVTAIKQKYNSFNSAGRYLGDGLVKGINAKQTAAYNAGYALGQKAVQGELDGQQSNSPSKATYKSGIWFGEGLINALSYMGKSVSNAGYRLGETAVDSLAKSITKVSDVASGKLDIQPSIRPVLDTSNLRTEKLRLGVNVSTLISQPVNSMSRIMADTQARIEASNREVIDAVNKFHNDINDAMNTEPDEQEIALYVDSKKLASSIAKPMDRQLNILSKRRALT